jgi:GH15 family glucan-1,4-alpha-glucosidase
VALFLVCAPAFALETTTPSWHQTSLATGNGYGFAVVSPETGKVTGLYAHPYKFVRPNPKYPLGEGIETTNFIKSMSWDGSSQLTAPTVEYQNESNVISVQTPSSRQTYFMPFGVERNVLIASCSGLPTGGASRLAAQARAAAKPAGTKGTSSAPPPILWRHKITSRQITNEFGKRVEVLQFAEVPESLAMVTLDASKNGAQSIAFISLEKPADLTPSMLELLKWQSGRNSAEMVAHELQQLEAWRVKPKVTFQSDAERKLWRQSEVVMRMAQIKEPNTAARHSHGIIIACLPDSAWFMTWARDMAYITLALIRMGHQQEARWALEGYLNARPVGKMQKEVGNVPYQVSVARYFGDGSEEPYFTEEGATNIEFDDWGLVLYALSQYVERFGDRSFLHSKTYRGTVYENAERYIASPLMANLEPYKDGLIVTADTSIWEERQKDKKHFAFSTAAALAGLRGFGRLAQSNGDQPFVNDLQDKIALLQRGFKEAFVRSGRLTGTLETGIKNDVDGATLNAILLGATDDRDLIQGTVAAMEQLKMPSGGYRRVHSIVEDPKIFEYWYERQEFGFTDFALANVLLQLGDTARANELVETILTKAAQDHNFIPEMYVSEVNDRFTGPIGAPTGVIPIVSYGAAAFVDYIINREEHRSKGQ